MKDLEYKNDPDTNKMLNEKKQSMVGSFLNFYLGFVIVLHACAYSLLGAVMVCCVCFFAGQRVEFICCSEKAVS